MPFLVVTLVYAKRRVWSFIKSQQFVYRTMKNREWTPESSAEPPSKTEAINKARNPPKLRTE